MAIVGRRANMVKGIGDREAEAKAREVVTPVPLIGLATVQELVQAEAELEHGPVAVQELAQVEAEQEHAQVEVPPEHVQVAEVPGPGQPRAQQVEPLRTRSVTAAHRRGLAPRLVAVEDLAEVAVETSLALAVAEAVAAWAAAG
jgi:hypothetical protein